MNDQTTGQIHILHLVGEDTQGHEVLRRPLTGAWQPHADESDENDNLVHQIAVLVVGLDWMGRVLAVVPHKPTGPLQVVTESGLGQTLPLDDEHLLQDVARFLLNSPADEIQAVGPRQHDDDRELYSRDPLDRQAVLAQLGLPSEELPEQVFAGLLQLFLDGFFTPQGARQFAAALLVGYQSSPVR